MRKLNQKLFNKQKQTQARCILYAIMLVATVILLACPEGNNKSKVNEQKEVGDQDNDQDTDPDTDPDINPGKTIPLTEKTEYYCQKEMLPDFSNVEGSQVYEQLSALHSLEEDKKPSTDAKLQCVYFSKTGTRTIDDKDTTDTTDTRAAGTSWDTAYAPNQLKRFMDEIQDANRDHVYVLLLAKGTYTPLSLKGMDYVNSGLLNSSFVMKNYVALIGGWDGTDANIHDTQKYETILNGESALDNGSKYSARHVITNSYSSDTRLNASAILYGVTVTRGVTSSTNSKEWGGGGMHNVYASPSIIRVQFKENAANRGGAIYNHYSSPIIIQSQFIGNTAFQFGAGIYNSYSSPTIIQSTFKRNKANSFGGAVENYYSSTTIIESSFSENFAKPYGGALYASNASSFTILKSTFVDNKTIDTRGAEYAGGAAIHCEATSSITVVQSVFSNNQTLYGTKGGAISGNARCTALVIKSIFVGNFATSSGGAISSEWKSNIDIVQSTFIDNLANGKGGAIYSDHDGIGRVRLANVILWANSQGGADDKQSNQLYLDNNDNKAEKASLSHVILQEGRQGIGKSTDEASFEVLDTGLIDGDPYVLYESDEGDAAGDNSAADDGGADDAGDNAGDDSIGIDIRAANNEEWLRLMEIVKIGEGSSAIDKGLYIYALADYSKFYYCRREKAACYSDIDLTKAYTGELPALELTATDARGYARVGAPDIGAFEYGAQASK